MVVQLTLLAWSGDGGSALVQRAVDGRPSWLVVNAAGVHAYDPAADCKGAAKALAKALGSYDGVKVRAEKCASDVAAVVEVDEAQRARVAKSHGAPDVRIEHAGKKLRVLREGHDVEVVKLDHRPKDVAWAAAGPLVLVVEPPSELLAAVFTTPRGLVTVDLGGEDP